MATNVDNGDQNLTFDYKNPATGSSFNKLLYQLLPTGLYGDMPVLTKVDNTHVEVSPFYAILEDDANDLAIKVNTTTTSTAVVSSSAPLIVVRYDWSESSENYAEIVGINSGDLTSSDVIIGECSFSGSVLSETFDYSQQYDSNFEVSKGEGADTWDASTTYSSTQIVMRAGFQYFTFNTTDNTNKDPLTSPDYWIKTPSKETLLDMFSGGLPQLGTLSAIDDRTSANYQQHALIGNYEIDGSFYEFYKVHLDGTTITGNAELEAIFDPDGTDEYFNIDLIAPEVLSSRTLIDCGEYIATPQSSGGNNDTVGTLLEDRFQGHWHRQEFTRALNGGTASNTSLQTGDSSQGTSTFLTGQGDPSTDTINGTPRTGLTTRPKELTVGASYIIVMVAA